MKKKLIIGIVIAVLLILIIPIPVGVYKDGGTRVYQAFTYKIVKWNRLTDMGTYSNIRVYPFPKSMLSIDELWELEKDTFVMCGDEPVVGPDLGDARYDDAYMVDVPNYTAAVNLMKTVKPREVVKKAADNEFVESQMKFALDLLKQTVTGKENVLISPLSISAALAMTANGAGGDTLVGMENVIADKLGIDKLNEYLSAYLDSLPVDDKCKVKIANSIWIRDDERLTVNQEFLQTNADYYRAGVYKAAFDNSTLKDINTWVEDNTDGLIKNILDEIPDDAVLYLINTLLFDAEWQAKYRKGIEVLDGTFTAADGTKENASMMYSVELQYIEGENVTGFMKDYRGGYKFVALLPKEGLTVEDYIASLNEETLSRLISNPEKAVVETYLPKFEYEYNILLNDVLKALGMDDAFDSTKADFKNIAVSSRGNIYIGRVLHKTFIDLNEDGTKAGAATVVEMIEECGIAHVENGKKVVLDRPFVYMIVEGETGLPLFTGVVTSVTE